MRLDDVLTLSTASRYLHPENSADKLAVVFGDFVSPETRDPTEQGGCLRTTLIDTQNWIYHLSDSLIPNEPIEVYAQQNTPFGVIVDPALYTRFYGDYENAGREISYIQFNAGGPSPRDYHITWRGRGTLNGPVLVNDPVTMIFMMFTAVGNWKSTDFDPEMLFQAIGIAEALGIPVHWVFEDDQTYGQILTDVFENYLADISFNSNGQLRISYNLWPIAPIDRTQVAQPYLDARMDVDGDDPEDAVSYRLAQENLVNEVVIRGRHNWATDKQATEIRYAHLPSQNAYASRKVRPPFLLKGIRTVSHATTWIQLFLSPLVELPGVVTIPLKALLPYAHMQRGTFIALTWSAGPDPLGRGWNQRILKVLETQTNYLAQTHGLKCFDTGLSVIPPQAVPFRAQNNSLWYLRVNPATQTLEFVNTLPFPWVSAGAERHWVTRAAPIGSTVYILPDASGNIVLTTVLPGVGSGNSDAVLLVDWYFLQWDIQITANPPTPVIDLRARPNGHVNVVTVT